VERARAKTQYGRNGFVRVWELGLIKACYGVTKDLRLPLSQPARPVNSERPPKAAIWVVAGLCACAAVYLFIIGALSFSALRSVALSAVPPGYENRFTLDLYLRIVFSLRLLAATLCLLSIALAVFAAPLSLFLIQTLRDIAAFGRDVARRTTALRYDPLHLFALLAVLLGATILRLAFLEEPIRNDGLAPNFETNG